MYNSQSNTPPPLVPVGNSGAATSASLNIDLLTAKVRKTAESTAAAIAAAREIARNATPITTERTDAIDALTDGRFQVYQLSDPTPPLFQQAAAGAVGGGTSSSISSSFALNGSGGGGGVGGASSPFSSGSYVSAAGLSAEAAIEARLAAKTAEAKRKSQQREDIANQLVAKQQQLLAHQMAKDSNNSNSNTNTNNNTTGGGNTTRGATDGANSKPSPVSPIALGTVVSAARISGGGILGAGVPGMENTFGVEAEDAKRQREEERGGGGAMPSFDLEAIATRQRDEILNFRGSLSVKEMKAKAEELKSLKERLEKSRSEKEHASELTFELTAAEEKVAALIDALGDVTDELDACTEHLEDAKERLEAAEKERKEAMDELPRAKVRKMELEAKEEEIREALEEAQLAYDRKKTVIEEAEKRLHDLMNIDAEVINISSSTNRSKRHGKTQQKGVGGDATSSNTSDSDSDDEDTTANNGPQRRLSSSVEGGGGAQQPRRQSMAAPSPIYADGRRSSITVDQLRNRRQTILGLATEGEAQLRMKAAADAKTRAERRSSKVVVVLDGEDAAGAAAADANNHAKKQVSGDGDATPSSVSQDVRGEEGVGANSEGGKKMGKKKGSKSKSADGTQGKKSKNKNKAATDADDDDASAFGTAIIGGRRSLLHHPANKWSTKGSYLDDPSAFTKLSELEDRFFQEESVADEHHESLFAAEGGLSDQLALEQKKRAAKANASAVTRTNSRKTAVMMRRRGSNANTEDVTSLGQRRASSAENSSVASSVVLAAATESEGEEAGGGEGGGHGGMADEYHNGGADIASNTAARQATTAAPTATTGVGSQWAGPSSAAAAAAAATAVASFRAAGRRIPLSLLHQLPHQAAAPPPTFTVDGVSGISAGVAQHTLDKQSARIKQLTREVERRKQLALGNEQQLFALRDRFDHLRVELLALRRYVSENEWEAVRDLKAQVRFYQQERVTLYTRLYSHVKEFVLPSVTPIYETLLDNSGPTNWSDANGKPSPTTSPLAPRRFTTAALNAVTQLEEIKQAMAKQIEAANAEGGHLHMQRIIDGLRMDISRWKLKCENRTSKLDAMRERLELVEKEAMFGNDLQLKGTEEISRRLELLFYEASVAEKRSVEREAELHEMYGAQLKSFEAHISTLEEDLKTTATGLTASQNECYEQKRRIEDLEEHLAEAVAEKTQLAANVPEEFYALLNSAAQSMRDDANSYEAITHKTLTMLCPDLSGMHRISLKPLGVFESGGGDAADATKSSSGGATTLSAAPTGGGGRAAENAAPTMRTSSSSSTSSASAAAAVAALTLPEKLRYAEKTLSNTWEPFLSSTLISDDTQRTISNVVGSLRILATEHVRDSPASQRLLQMISASLLRLVEWWQGNGEALATAVNSFSKKFRSVLVPENEGCEIGSMTDLQMTRIQQLLQKEREHHENLNAQQHHNNSETSLRGSPRLHANGSFSNGGVGGVSPGGSRRPSGTSPRREGGGGGAFLSLTPRKGGGRHNNGASIFDGEDDSDEARSECNSYSNLQIAANKGSPPFLSSPKIATAEKGVSIGRSFVNYSIAEKATQHSSTSFRGVKDACDNTDIQLGNSQSLDAATDAFLGAGHKDRREKLEEVLRAQIANQSAIDKDLAVREEKVARAEATLQHRRRMTERFSMLCERRMMAMEDQNEQLAVDMKVLAGYRQRFQSRMDAGTWIPPHELVQTASVYSQCALLGGDNDSTNSSGAEDGGAEGNDGLRNVKSKVLSRTGSILVAKGEGGRRASSLTPSASGSTFPHSQRRKSHKKQQNKKGSITAVSAEAQTDAVAIISPMATLADKSVENPHQDLLLANSTEVSVGPDGDANNITSHDVASQVEPLIDYDVLETFYRLHHREEDNGKLKPLAPTVIVEERAVQTEDGSTSAEVTSQPLPQIVEETAKRSDSTSASTTASIMTAVMVAATAAASTVDGHDGGGEVTTEWNRVDSVADLVSFSSEQRVPPPNADSTAAVPPLLTEEAWARTTPTPPSLLSEEEEEAEKASDNSRVDSALIIAQLSLALQESQGRIRLMTACLMGAATSLRGNEEGEQGSQRASLSEKNSSSSISQLQQQLQSVSSDAPSFRRSFASSSFNPTANDNNSPSSPPSSSSFSYRLDNMLDLLRFHHKQLASLEARRAAKEKRRASQFALRVQQDAEEATEEMDAANAKQQRELLIVKQSLMDLEDAAEAKEAELDAIVARHTDEIRLLKVQLIDQKDAFLAEQYDLKERVEMLEERVRVADKRTEEAIEDARRFETENTRLRGELAAANHNNDGDEEEDMDQIAQSLSAAAANVGGAPRPPSEAAARLTLQSKHQLALAEKQEEIDTLKQANRQQKLELDRLRMAGGVGSIDSAAVERLQREADTLRAENNTLVSRLRTMETDNAEMMRDLSALQQEKQQQKRRSTITANRTTGDDADNSESQQQQQQLLLEDELRRECAALREEKEQFKKRLGALATVLEAFEAEKTTTNRSDDDDHAHHGGDDALTIAAANSNNRLSCHTRLVMLHNYLMELFSVVKAAMGLPIRGADEDAAAYSDVRRFFTRENIEEGVLPLLPLFLSSSSPSSSSPAGVGGDTKNATTNANHRNSSVQGTASKSSSSPASASVFIPPSPEAFARIIRTLLTTADRDVEHIIRFIAAIKRKSGGGGGGGVGRAGSFFLSSSSSSTLLPPNRGGTTVVTTTRDRIGAKVIKDDGRTEEAFRPGDNDDNNKNTSDMYDAQTMMMPTTMTTKESITTDQFLASPSSSLLLTGKPPKGTQMNNAANGLDVHTASNDNDGGVGSTVRSISSILLRNDAIDYSGTDKGAKNRKAAVAGKMNQQKKRLDTIVGRRTLIPPTLINNGSSNSNTSAAAAVMMRLPDGTLALAPTSSTAGARIIDLLPGDTFPSVADDSGNTTHEEHQHYNTVEHHNAHSTTVPTNRVGSANGQQRQYQHPYQQHQRDSLVDYCAIRTVAEDDEAHNGEDDEDDAVNRQQQQQQQRHYRTPSSSSLHNAEPMNRPFSSSGSLILGGGGSSAAAGGGVGGRLGSAAMRNGSGGGRRLLAPINSADRQNQVRRLVNIEEEAGRDAANVTVVVTPVVTVAEEGGSEAIKMPPTGDLMKKSWKNQISASLPPPPLPSANTAVRLPTSPPRQVSPPITTCLAVGDDGRPHLSPHRVLPSYSALQIEIQNRTNAVSTSGLVTSSAVPPLSFEKNSNNNTPSSRLHDDENGNAETPPRPPPPHSSSSAGTLQQQRFFSPYTSNSPKISEVYKAVMSRRGGGGGGGLDDDAVNHPAAAAARRSSAPIMNMTTTAQPSLPFSPIRVTDRHQQQGTHKLTTNASSASSALVAVPLPTSAGLSSQMGFSMLRATATHSRQGMRPAGAGGGPHQPSSATITYHHHNNRSSDAIRSSRCATGDGFSNHKSASLDDEDADGSSEGYRMAQQSTAFMVLRGLSATSRPVTVPHVDTTGGGRRRAGGGGGGGEAPRPITDGLPPRVGTSHGPLMAKRNTIK